MTGTRVHVRDERAAWLLAAGYRKSNPTLTPDAVPAKPVRRKVTRADARTRS